MDEREALAESLPLVEVKPHEWRMCPLGQHYVHAHARRVKVTKEHPDGVTNVRAHCRQNHSHKDQMYFEEIRQISGEYFSRLPPNDLPAQRERDRSGFPPNAFDEIIGGWTRYWNEVLRPEVPLDPDIVKALIFSESSYNPDVRDTFAGRRAGYARGLMQVTDQSLDILADEGGEVPDFLVDVDQQDMSDHSVNICVGIRWLFHKRRLLKSKLSRDVTWEEAVAEYKSYTEDIQRGEMPGNYKKFLDELSRLRSVK